MCPVCIATAALVTTGVASAGGLTAFAFKKVRSAERPAGFLKPDRSEGKPKEKS